jgi:hypothetical protein
MNPYTILSSGLDTIEARDLSTRLSAWHDAMVAHERRLRTGSTSDACDDECPHAEARLLWSEAVATFGARARELAFLRSRAQDTRRAAHSATRAYAHREPAHGQHRLTSSRPDAAAMSSAAAATELS